MKILLTGANGQLGSELVRLNPADCSLTALSHAQLDITNAEASLDIISKTRPDWVINAAAYTNVEEAEEEPEKAMRVNGDGAFHLANAVRKTGGRFLQVSTDFVFDGRLRRPYRPDDVTAPINSYGQSKLAGERAVLSLLGEEALIIRTSWLYSSRRQNFLTTMLRLFREQETLNVVNDQFGSPTSVTSLAEVILAAIKADIRGIHHWCDDGNISWHGFAKAIQHEALEIGKLAKFKEIKAIASSEYPTKAIRPAWSVLDCSSLRAAVRMPQQPWRGRLQMLMRQNKTELWPPLSQKSVSR